MQMKMFLSLFKNKQKTHQQQKPCSLQIIPCKQFHTSQSVNAEPDEND